jgi:hypothetical protein
VLGADDFIVSKDPEQIKVREARLLLPDNILPIGHYMCPCVSVLP